LGGIRLKDETESTARVVRVNQQFVARHRRISGRIGLPPGMEAANIRRRPLDRVRDDMCRRDQRPDQFGRRAHNGLSKLSATLSPTSLTLSMAACGWNSSANAIEDYLEVGPIEPNNRVVGDAIVWMARTNLGEAMCGPGRGAGYVRHGRSDVFGDL
jgi:hypothetical protein